AMRNGEGRMREWLATLPGSLNWQTAFYQVYRDDFKRPLDVEKWWSLRVIRLASHDLGPRWSLADSRARVTEILAVPVEYRSEPTALPTYATISLQNAIQNFTPEQCQEVLRLKLRDMEMAQLRLAQPYAGLVAGYRQVIAEYLGGKRAENVNGTGHLAASPRRFASRKETLKQLDTLDARRRAAEERMDANPATQNRSGTANRVP
ncbi:MAG TPA: hypothetical protein VF607_04590, partial [Verrucomicrobiae bacterium]